MIIVRRVIKHKLSANFSGGFGTSFWDNYGDQEWTQVKPPPTISEDTIRALDRTVKISTLGLGLATVGAGVYYLRKRKSKNGKQIIERVRR